MLIFRRRAPSVCIGGLYMYVSSVTLVPRANTVGRNEMPFGRDTRVIPSNIVLDRGPSAPREKEFLGSEPPARSDSA